eukprot:jgi/Hompol1/535/HPOL_004495-RA
MANKLCCDSLERVQNGDLTNDNPADLLTTVCDDEAEELERNFNDENNHRTLDRRFLLEDNTDAEKIAERFKQTYGRGDATRSMYRGDVEHIPQSMLIPSVNDPKLWLVRCKPGKEKDLVHQMMTKYEELEYSQNPLRILSVFARESLPGYFYIEAEKQAHVSEAIQGVINMYGSKLTLVPIHEMVDCLNIKTKDIGLKHGQWVRMKRGKYDGDLAQICEVPEGGDTVIVKLIPRLDLAKGPKDLRTDVNGKRKKASEARHPQKMFQPNDFSPHEVTKTPNGYSYAGEMFDRQGYLEKQVKVSSLKLESVNPTLDEITRFTGGSIGERSDDLALLASANQATADDFQIGESITIMSGELANMPGVIESIEGGIVSIRADAGMGLQRAVRYPLKDIQKRFELGNH